MNTKIWIVRLIGALLFLAMLLILLNIHSRLVRMTEEKRASGLDKVEMVEA